METKTIDNLAIRSAPRLGGKEVNDPAANSELVKPLMKNPWFRGPQQREPDTFKPDALLAHCGIGPHQSHCALEHPVSYGMWRAVSATEILVGVQGKLSTENNCIEAECFARCAGESDIDLRRHHVQIIQSNHLRIAKTLQGFYLRVSISALPCGDANQR